MGIFDRFPYSSTHEMNLDFMLGKATEIAESLQEVQDGLSDIDTHKTQAEQAAQAAQASQAAASASAGQAAQHVTDAEDAADRAEAAATEAETAADRAEAALGNMTDSETVCLEAAEEAQQYAEASQTHSNQAMLYKNDAETAKNNAAVSASQASISAGSAANSATDAASSASSANVSATNANLHASNAETSATNAATSATNAATSATNAAASANGIQEAADHVESLVESLPEDFTDLNNEVNDLKSAIRTPINLINGTTVGKGIDYSDGTEMSSSNLIYTDYIDISGISELIYTQLCSTSSSTKAGMAFYDTNKTYISGQRAKLLQSETHYEMRVIEVPSTAVYARFTGNKNIAGTLTAYDYDDYMAYIPNNVDKLNQEMELLLPPDYKGKKVSILGDSISTFALEAGTGSGDKYAGANCTTNYPGNRVRFPFGDVLDVDDMWWKIVFDKFGWTLGINDSWAGSRITWQGGESEVTGANIYIGSPTRIGHLDENGTPDIIFIFAGTNDINNLSVSRIGELPTDDPSNYTTEELNALPVNQFYGAVTAMVLRIQHEYPDAKILALLPYYVTDNYGTTPYTVKLFDDALAEVYDYLGVDYLDLRKIVNIYDIQSALGDALHPNKAGMKMIANAVISKLKDIL